MSHPALDSLHPAVRAWFTGAYGSPSPPQALGWPAIAAGRNVLILAPTGSGKTLAAFVQCISALYEEAAGGGKVRSGVRVLYVSPLKALNNDIHRNLEQPLAGIAEEAQKLGLTLPPLRAAIRTGDTTAAERRRILRDPPEILITTPESLFLMLSSGAREILRGVDHVIVDEIHSLFPNKRGVHLALTLEHLAAVAKRDFQRIGLSATQRPLDEAASFLGGGNVGEDGVWRPRPVEIIDTGQRKELDLRLILPVEDLRTLPEKTVWPSIYRRLLALVREHRSTLIFVNNRRLAERVTANLNDLAGGIVARTHHGSLAKEQRLELEELLKSGGLPCLVATSSLELGIDVGAIDLVVQVESPKEVARGLQRVGRAGHLVGLPSKGRIIPKTRDDLLECAALVREMRDGLVEAAHAPANCLDVLAQQLVSLVCVEERGADELFRIVRRAGPYRDLPRARFNAVLGMLAGDDGGDGGRFLELRPRVHWDRINDLVRAAERGRRLVYTSGGVIPDRGYFGVYLSGGNVRLGELDEEFVSERRLGERFVLGTSAWRIEEIRRDRVIVAPARRGEAMIPFWKGETVARPFELGQRFGRFLEELQARVDAPDFEAWARAECLLDEPAARNLRQYLQAQNRAAGPLPTGTRLVVEEFQDELGEWRVLLHSPFGARVHAPLALLLQEELKKRAGLEVEIMHNDNGLLLVCPGALNPPRLDLNDLPLATLPESLAEAVRGTSLFARLFRENAARALLLPRAPYGRNRTPLWLARVRAGDLLQTVSDRPDFPLILETMRECLTEVFDIEGLYQVLSGVRSGRIEVRRMRSRTPSPFSQALQFNFFGTYMYVPDLPKGERKFRALGLNREALREILGAQGLRELLDPAAIDAARAEAEGTAPDRLPRNADDLHDWMRFGRELAPLPPLFCEREGEEGLIAKSLLETLKAHGRVVLLSWPVEGDRREAWVAAEDAPTYLAGLPGSQVLWAGTDLSSQTGAGDDARRRLVRRYTKTHGPFTLDDLASHYGLARNEAAAELTALEEQGLIQSGEFTPGLTEVEWCDVDILQRIHRRSLAKARREIEPRGASEYAAFLARWQSVGGTKRGSEALTEILTRLSGLYLPFPAWGGGVLPLRVRDFRLEMLERLMGTGRFVWAARGSGEEMRVGFLNDGELTPRPPLFREREGEAGMPGVSSLPAEAEKVRSLLQARGALFLDRIVQGTGFPPAAALEALETLMAAGLATNDTLGPLHYFGARRPVDRPYYLTQADLNAMGRWSLLEPGPEPTPETIAEILLQRYGLVTKDHFQRDFSPGEPEPGAGSPRPAGRGHDDEDDDRYAWGDILGVLDRWEAIGRVRRGYFVEGLGGLQYALPEAVEMLRMPVEEGLPEYWAILKIDPANPYGPLLPLPEMDLQPEILVLRHGIPVLAAGGKKVRFARLDEGLRGEALKEALKTWAGLAGWRGENKVAVAEFAGHPAGESEAAEILREMGFERGYKEMARWMG